MKTTMLTQGYFELNQLNNYMVNSLNLPNILSEVKPIEIINNDNKMLIGKFIPVDSISIILNQKTFRVLQCEVIQHIFDKEQITFLN